MSVTEKAAALFRSHAAGLIDFSLDDLKVNAGSLRKVGEAITKGTIGVEVGETGPMLSAAYSRKRLLLRKESETDYPEGQAAIVHEGVHAWADLSNHRSGLSEEAAAYLTEVVYLRVLNRRISGIRSTMRPTSWPALATSSTDVACISRPPTTRTSGRPFIWNRRTKI
jgi:hypothetical protein